MKIAFLKEVFLFFNFSNFIFFFHMCKGWDILVYNSYSYHTGSYLALNQTYKWTDYKKFSFYGVSSVCFNYLQVLHAVQKNICIDLYSNWETKSCLEYFHCICSLQPGVSRSSMFPLCRQMCLLTKLYYIIRYICTIVASWVRKLVVMLKVLFRKQCPKIKSQLNALFY